MPHESSVEFAYYNSLMQSFTLSLEMWVLGVQLSIVKICIDLNQYLKCLNIGISTKYCKRFSGVYFLKHHAAWAWVLVPCRNSQSKFCDCLTNRFPTILVNLAVLKIQLLFCCGLVVLLNTIFINSWKYFAVEACILVQIELKFFACTFATFTTYL